MATKKGKTKKVTKSKPRRTPKQPMKIRQTRKTTKSVVEFKKSLKLLKKVDAAPKPRKFTLKPAVPIEDVKDFTARTKLPALVTEVRELDGTIAAIFAENADVVSELQAQRGELLEQIKAIVVDADLITVEGADWRLSYVAGVRKSLDPQLLLAKGVTMATIKACTVEKPTKPFVRISAKDETVENEEA